MPRKPSQRGYTAVEMMVTMIVIVIAAAIAFFSLADTLPVTHVNTALDTTMQVLRSARQKAIDQRTTIQVTLNAPSSAVHSLTVYRIVPSGTPVFIETIPLPSDVQFYADPSLAGIPNPPDKVGNGQVAIDFEDPTTLSPGNQVYFLPDGSGRSSNGNVENGVVYIDRPGYWKFTRAISMFGATGRLRSWRLQQTSPGVWAWQ